MIRTEPDGQAVDPVDLQMSYPRGRSDRPWVVANFISTIDGAAVVDGGSTAINDEDDKAMFAAIRTVADFILVGAGTVRAENYGPPSMDEARRERRMEARLDPEPHLVIVSGSLSVDPSHRVFGDPENRVTLLTSQEAPGDRVESLSEVADVVQLDDMSADGILRYMRMGKVVLCEGGPSLFGQFVSEGLVDEMAWTVAPMLVAGDSPRISHSAERAADPEMRLDRVLYGDRSLFLRYLRS